MNSSFEYFDYINMLQHLAENEKKQAISIKKRDTDVLDPSNKKKRIHIPNATIRNSFYRQQQNIGGDHETTNKTTKYKNTEKENSEYTEKNTSNFDAIFQKSDDGELEIINI